MPASRWSRRATPIQGAAAKLARLAPQARLVADAAELAADPAVDCLYIATPPARHLAHAHLAFDRGKAVFCEKPLATDLALAQAAVDRAEREHRVAAVNLPFASAPAVPALASGLRSGELSGIEHVDIEVAFARWPRPQQETAHWLGRREEGGFVREALRRRRPAKGAAPPANPGPEAGTAILHILRVARRPRPCRPSP